MAGGLMSVAGQHDARLLQQGHELAIGGVEPAAQLQRSSRCESIGQRCWEPTHAPDGRLVGGMQAYPGRLEQRHRVDAAHARLSLRMNEDLGEIHDGNHEIDPAVTSKLEQPLNAWQ